MKTYSKRVIIGFLSMLFFANVTFAHSVDFHMCQGELQSIAFFGKKASCTKMIEAQMAEPKSCCDQKREVKGIAFRKKSCCDNVQLLQDYQLNHPSHDLVDVDFFQVDVWLDFASIVVPTKMAIVGLNQEEIPDPPDVLIQHSQEKLQVFII